MKTLLIALTCGLLHTVATAEGCEDLVLEGVRIISRDTRNAGDAIEKLVRQAGVAADLRAIRLRTLKTDFPRADVEVTTHRMLQAFCEVVWADRSLGDDRKAARVQAAEQEMTRTAQGPTEIARTGTRIRNGRYGDGRILLAMAGGDGPVPALWPAFAQANPPQPAAADEVFLREVPTFINASNKYFVLVGSADSEEKAVRLMHALKAKAPKYDFVVYQPYGANGSYGVMMATWVSYEVAQKALREARAAVARDAFLWACRSTGESC